MPVSLLRVGILGGSLLLSIFFGGCGCHEAEMRERARRVWRLQEGRLSALSEGRPVNGEEFDRACDFFQRVAGISVPRDHSGVVGWIPSSETDEALEPIRRWYSVHGDELYWDEDTFEVVVRRPNQKKFDARELPATDAARRKRDQTSPPQ